MEGSLAPVLEGYFVLCGLDDVAIHGESSLLDWMEDEGRDLRIPHIGEEETSRRGSCGKSFRRNLVLCLPVSSAPFSFRRFRANIEACTQCREG